MQRSFTVTWIIWLLLHAAPTHCTCSTSTRLLEYGDVIAGQQAVILRGMKKHSSLSWIEVIHKTVEAKSVLYDIDRHLLDYCMMLD